MTIETVVAAPTVADTHARQDPSSSIDCEAGSMPAVLPRVIEINCQKSHVRDHEWGKGLAARIASAIDPTVAVPIHQDWQEFEIRHALRVRIYELERDAAILKSRLRATVPNLDIASSTGRATL